jgi:hypothetical protein
VITVNAKYFVVNLPKLPDDPSTIVDYWKNFPKKLRIIEGNTRLNIEKKLYAEAAESYVYKAVDKNRNQNMVVKLPKEYKDLGDQYKYVKSRELRSAIAAQLTRFYRKATKDINKAPPLFYVTPVIYFIDEEFNGNKYIFAEPDINIDDTKFEKWSNNLTESNNDAYTSFSHFTHYASGLNYLVNYL